MIDTASKSTCSCPINGKVCIDGTRDDFEKDANGRLIKCRWWQHLFGKDPQSEKQIDQWDCAIAWLPIVTVEGAQMSRQTGASVDKVASQVSEVRQSIAAMSGAIRVAAAGISQAIEGGALTVMLPPPVGPGETNGKEKDLLE